MIDLVARLRAYEAGRAIRSATHLQVAIQPHALVIVPLAMAGEDTFLHGIAVGTISGPSEIRIIPDPRVRDEQYALIEWLGEIVERYYQERRARGEFPQVWVSSEAVAGQLDILADRLRFTRDAPAIKRTGDLLTYVTERRPVAGQQALVTATGALSLHYATGQQRAEDEHLGTFLTWLEPPEGVDIRHAVERAERDVMGVKTDPEFDRRELAPLISAFNRARKAGASVRELEQRRAAIETRLQPIIEAIYAAVQRALGFLQGQFPPAGILANLAAQEADEFASFMTARDKGMPLPYRDTPKAGAFKITARELAIQNADADAVYGDTMAQARARLGGRILTGLTANATITKAGNKKLHRFDVESAQTNLHLRSGDKIALLANSGLRCVVEGVRRGDASTRVSLLVAKGMNSVGMPTDGTSVDFTPPPAEWDQLIRLRGKMSKRLATTPWTHADGVPVAGAGSPVAKPADLLAAVEALR
jgi:hypothetical protein